MNQLCDLLMFRRWHDFWFKLWHIGAILVLCLGLSLGGCQARPQVSPVPSSPPLSVANLSEVSPPAALEELNEWFDQYQPQVEILSPSPDEVLPDTRVSLELAVKGLPIFRDLVTGLGPYLQVTLDNQASRSIYSVEQPIVIEDLSPGTHTLRVVAVRPWGESFKTAGAFAQVTFHTLTRSMENTPKPQQPLLTYNQPQGIYGSEPFLLDFYLSNAPLHSLAKADPNLSDWQVRCTINGTSFKVDQWQSFYLTGLTPGKNWVRLELLDARGTPIETVFNPTTWVVDYRPGGQDVRSRLLRGELTAAQVQGILSQNLESALPPLTPAEPEAPPTETMPEPAPTPESSESLTVLESLEPTGAPADIPPAAASLEKPEATEEPKNNNDSTATPPAPTVQPQQRSWRNFLNRKQTEQPLPQAPVMPSESLDGLDEVEPQVENQPQQDIVSSENPEVEPSPETNTTVVSEPLQPTPQDWKKRWQNYLSRPQSAPSPPAASANSSEPSPSSETITAEESEN